mmetsp:Transcript_32470/g.49681  ORF Transcript_32470/g.49681 Transcript_32470/m.49681 type:complete len:97 (+) Transcript_32470:190-480(+)
MTSNYLCKTPTAGRVSVEVHAGISGKVFSNVLTAHPPPRSHNPSNFLFSHKNDYDDFEFTNDGDHVAVAISRRLSPSCFLCFSIRPKVPTPSVQPL